MAWRALRRVGPVLAPCCPRFSLLPPPPPISPRVPAARRLATSSLVLSGEWSAAGGREVRRRGWPAGERPGSVRSRRSPSVRASPEERVGCRSRGEPRLPGCTRPVPEVAGGGLKGPALPRNPRRVSACQSPLCRSASPWGASRVVGDEGGRVERDDDDDAAASSPGLPSSRTGHHCPLVQGCPHRERGEGGKASQNGWSRAKARSRRGRLVPPRFWQRGVRFNLSLVLVLTLSPFLLPGGAGSPPLAGRKLLTSSPRRSFFSKVAPAPAASFTERDERGGHELGKNKADSFYRHRRAETACWELQGASATVQERGKNRWMEEAGLQQLGWCGLPGNLSQIFGGLGPVGAKEVWLCPSHQLLCGAATEVVRQEMDLHIGAWCDFALNVVNSESICCCRSSLWMKVSHRSLKTRICGTLANRMLGEKRRRTCYKSNDCH